MFIRDTVEMDQPGRLIRLSICIQPTVSVASALLSCNLHEKGPVLTRPVYCIQ